MFNSKEMFPGRPAQKEPGESVEACDKAHSWKAKAPDCHSFSVRVAINFNPAAV